MLKRQTGDLLVEVASFLKQQNSQAYFVGGFVRDWLLGKETADVDIAVAGDALKVAQKVAAAIRGRYVVLDEANRVARVVVTEEGWRWHLDFSSFPVRIEEDLARRDFTINAIAVEINQWSQTVDDSILIDPYGGRGDVKEGRIRAVSDDIFKADAARLLRAVRLAAELEFTIDSQTEALIRDYCELIAQVPGERVREELLRLLALPVAGDFMDYMDKLGLLAPIIPELTESKGVKQPKEHFWDVFDHSIETVRTVEYLLRERDWRHGRENLLAMAPWSEALGEYFTQEVSKDSHRKMMLKFAGLLHDVAKPKTKTIDDKGKMHFLGHAKEGAAIASAILERLRFSGKEVELVETLVYHHLRPVQMASRELPTHRAIYRYFRDTEGAGIDILFLALADYLATQGPNLDLAEWRSHCQLIGYILGEYFREKVVPLPRLVNGHGLMKTFGLTPGKRIGRLLEAVREAQAAGEIATREEAIALVQRMLSQEEINLERVK